MQLSVIDCHHFDIWYYSIGQARLNIIAETFTITNQGLVSEGVVEILPALQSLLLEELNPAGPVQEAIGQFIAARQID